MLTNHAKRFFSFLLALVMVLSMVPVQALATEEDYHDHADTVSADSVQEVQALIDDCLDYYLVFYGFELPQGDMTEEERTVKAAQIEDIVANAMDANERENALMSIREVETAVEENLTDAQAEGLALANPVFLDFAGAVSEYATAPETLEAITGLADTNISLDASGSNHTWTADGTAIAGQVYGSYTNKSTTLTITNQWACPVYLSFDFTYTIEKTSSIGSKGTVSVAGTKYEQASGSASFGPRVLATGEQITVKLESGSATSNKYTRINISNIAARGTVSFAQAQGNGTYTVDGVTAPVTKEMDNCGAQYQLVATPDEGYVFIGWYAGEERISGDATFTFKNRGNCTVQPKFGLSSIDVTFAEGENGSYTVKRSDGTEVAKGTPVVCESGAVYSLNAAPAEGYVFSGWRKSTDPEGVYFSRNAATSITIGADISEPCTITPVFVKEGVYALLVSYDNTLGSVAITGAGEDGNECYDNTPLTLTAEAASGSTFLGWTDAQGKILSRDATYGLTPTADVEVKAVFAKDGGNAVFGLGTAESRSTYDREISGILFATTFNYWDVSDITHLFEDLGAAAAAAGSCDSKNIVLMNSGTISGNYEIPSGVTLLIPFNDTNSLYKTNPVAKFTDVSPIRSDSAYRTLTMAPGASLTVFGEMSVSAMIYAAQGSGRGSGVPCGAYGYVKMGDDSKITVESGGKLYCYGYINGSGMVTVNSGADVYETFQFEDFRGGNDTTDMVSSGKRVFPLSDYYVQNVMVPLKLMAGATEYSYAAMYMSKAVIGSSVKFIGSSSSNDVMFNMASGSVTKYYDAARDRLVVDINGQVKISGIQMSLSTVTMNSADFELPINSNITINVRSGGISLQQGVALLPGAEINIYEGTNCTLVSGASLYVYDAEDWGGYVSTHNVQFLPLMFMPERTTTMQISDLKDAQINVYGSVTANGYVYTTKGGAAIRGMREGAAITMFSGLEDGITYQYVYNGNPPYVPFQVSDGTLTSAKLQNSDGTYTTTENIPVGDNGAPAIYFRYTNGQWVSNCSGGCKEENMTPATCQSPKKCNYCGKEYGELEAHLGDPEHPATCTEAQVCITCGAEVTAALGHDYVTKPAVTDSCQTGVTGCRESYQCRRCELYFSDKNGTQIGDETAWEAWKLNPNGGLVDDAVHTPGEVQTENVKLPGCLTDGSHDEVKYCTKCGEVVEKTTVVDNATGHSFGDWTTVTDSTCYSLGQKKQSCANCDAEQFADIPMKDHTPGAAATCTVAQVCTVPECGATIRPALGHTPGQPVKENEDTETGTYELVVYCAAEGCGAEIGRTTITPDVDNGHTGLVPLFRVEPTCTQDGREAGAECTDTECPVCQGTYKTGGNVIPALGHSLKDADVTYTLNSDCTVMTAAGKCDNCGDDYSVDSFSVTKKSETQATCEAAGKTVYTAVFPEEAKLADKDMEVAGSAKLEHDWSDPVVYTELEGNDTCTATWTCKHNTAASCVRTQTVNVTAVTTDATCEEDGCTTYTADFTVVWAEDQSKVVVGEKATGHSWQYGAPSYSADNMVCTMTASCGNEGCDAAKTVTSVDVDVQTVDATCTTAAKTTYTYTFAAELDIAPIVRTVNGSSLGHAWSSPVYTWSEDDTTCTATRTCSNDAAHVETETVGVTVDTSRGATCTAAGTVTHTSEAFENHAFAAQTKTTTQEALGHNTQFVAEVSATCAATGTAAHYLCRRCHEAFKDAEGSEPAGNLTLATVGHKYTEYVYQNDASCTKPGTEIASCDYGCGTNDTRNSAEHPQLSHNWGEYTFNEGSATCMADGTKTAYCTYQCGTSNTVTAEDTKLNHEYQEEVTLAPTCVAEGVKTLTCKNGCNGTKTEDIPALGHAYVLVTGQAATCEETGWENYYQCAADVAGSGERSYCGAYFEEQNDGTKTMIGETGSEAELQAWKTSADSTGYIAATGHDYDDGVVITRPTCLTKGVKIFTCGNDASHTYTEDVDMISHVGVEVSGQAATCQNPGWKNYYQCASGCMQYYADAACMELIGGETELAAWKTGNGAVPATGEHAWGEGYYASDDDKPACEKPGTLTRMCILCQVATTTEEVAALEHIWILDQDRATCTEDGYLYSKRCRLCKTEIDINEVIPALGHAPYVAGIIAYSTCTVAGSERVRCGNPGCDYETTRPMALEPHNTEFVAGTAATCTQTGVLDHYNCKICSNKFADAQAQTAMDTVVIPALGHLDVEVAAGKAADCVNDGYKEAYYCRVCEKSYGAKLSETEYTDEITVSLDAWRIAEDGGKLAALGHSEVIDAAVAAACETAGLTEGKHCDRCGETLVAQETVDALGHNYVGVITTRPTCTAEGIKTFTCQNDSSHKYTEPVASTGHDWEITYTWDGEDACRAEAVCKNNANHKVTDNAVVTLRTDVAADCDNDGSGTKIATFNDELFQIQEKAVTLPKLGHKFTAYKSDNNATCIDNGTETAVCDNGCGKTDQRVVENSALGHKRKLIEAKAPNCVQAGNIAHYQCTTCLKRFADDTTMEPMAESAHVLQALGHNYESVVTAPTCTAQGYTTYTCSNCQNSYVADYVGALGHNYASVVTTQPTCTEKGIKTFTCANDESHTYTENIAATGHSSKAITGQPANCELNGWKDYYRCQNDCGLFYEDAECTVLIGDGNALTAWRTTGNGVIAALGHSYRDVAGKTPNCENAGYLASFQCTRTGCGKYFSDKGGTVIGDGSEDAWKAWTEEEGEGYLSANGHTPDAMKEENTVLPGCEAAGSHDEVVYCQVCHDEISRTTVTDPATGHTEVTIPAKAPTCTATGLTEGTKCSVCNQILVAQTKVDAAGHNEAIDAAVESTCTATGLTEGKHCSVCNAILVAQTEVAMKSHVLSVVVSVTAPTCVANGAQVLKCANCSYETTEILPATGHTEAEIPAKAPTCIGAGATAGVKCAVCGEVLTEPQPINPTGHSYEDVITEPTCTAQGYTTHTCSVCGDVKTDTYVPMAAHTEVTDAAVAATCTATGLTEGKHCSVCNKTLVEQQVTAKIPHPEATDAAVAATCTATGLTEGKHCSACGKILVAQEAVPALGHAGKAITGQAPTCELAGWKDYAQCETCKAFFQDIDCRQPIEDLSAWRTTGDGKLEPLGHEWDDGRVTTLPTCVDEGVMTFTCLVCNGTRTEAEPALGHDLEAHTAQHPTYYSVGWEAYDSCKHCDYTTYVEIPALGEPSIETYDAFITGLKLLEDYANAYAKENPGKDPMLLLIKYVRTGVDRYNSGSWNIMAGYEDEGFAEYVKKQEETYNKAAATTEEMINVTGLKNIENFTLPNGDTVDFGHMFGTMDITYHNKGSINHADVSGWTGDLVDLLSTADRYNVTGTVEEMTVQIGQEYLGSDLGGQSDKFSQTDMYGDLDGFYIMQKLTGQDYHSGLLQSIMDSYFTESLTDEARADFFLKNRLGGVTSRNEIRDAVFGGYTGNSLAATLEGTREFKASDLSDMRKACCYAFADYLCKLAGDYVELGDNIYYSVFSSESSTLAPGITQQINKATTADGKQVIYYIATADVTSPYVSVYANYKDNDPGAGWGMQRVRDQANAAQAKYGDPDSEHYIENYNVIAAINAGGYNMTTGEPMGVLMMDSVEYQKPNGAGFFGILKDGSPCTGTDAQYNALKAQGLLKEAVAIFGSTLIKDGKIAVSAGGDYYDNRASRTAIGYTRTGKIVFMVMDGRQEPVSCGGSMIEIAQVMLEAGCIEAVNLDGGGSTTYVAKQEGEDALSLVSSPSDGFERSVSTSWIMVSTAPSSTAFDHAALDSKVKHLTVGATVQVTATGVSATGNPAELPAGAAWEVSDNSVASISADGVLTGIANGQVDVNLVLGNKILGSRTMYVVVPDAVYFTRENMNAVYGEPTQLPVAALYEGKPVAILESDVSFTLNHEAAGTTEGFTFTGNSESGVKILKITAHAVNNPDATSGSMNIALYSPGEASFDFDNATGGDRQLAWDRKVTNAATSDNFTYVALNVNQPMVSEYAYAIDMTQIPMPEELTELAYMLPGADVEGNNSAWSFLLQLAERVSVLTEVKPVLWFDRNVEVDYSKLSVNCEYFNLESAQLNPETNELTLSLRWKDQTKAIDPDTANPICIVSGIQLTPKENAAWDSKDRLNVVNGGSISYDIYLRANALYSFAQKPENQETYKLYPFVNPNDETEKGGHFMDTYMEFTDEYTLINGLKNGWIYEDGGYAYYTEGEKYYGVQKVGLFYYDFGETGINIGQTKFTGIFQVGGVNHYAKDGVLTSGWYITADGNYCFDENGVGYNGKVVMDEVELQFENGLQVGGYTGFIRKTNGKMYHYENGRMTYGWRFVGENLYHFNTDTGEMTTGTHVIPDDEAAAKGAYYDFADDGRTLRGYFNGFGYYYWAGQPRANDWVKEGSDPDPDAWYHTNDNGHFVTTPNANETFRLVLNDVTYTAVKIAYDGVEYTFDNTNGKLLLGSMVYENGKWYYYWAGEPVNDGWFRYNGETYYAYPDGHLATGSRTIDGESYMFTTQGVLVTEGVIIHATLSEGNEKLTVKVLNADKNMTSARMAIWATTAGQASTLKWNDLTRGGENVWTVTVPLCQFELKEMDTYELHVYGTVGGTEALVVNTTVADVTPAKHAYTHDRDDTCNNCGAVRELNLPTTPMYRLYNPNSGEHFYTGSAEERDMLVNAGWNYEGIAWNAPVRTGTPVYRVYNPNSGDHHYTMSQEEVDNLVALGWKYEGVAWNSAEPDAIPQFRLYNPNADVGSHHYTSSTEERDYLVSLGWRFEGIGWFGLLQ